MCLLGLALGGVVGFVLALVCQLSAEHFAYTGRFMGWWR